VEREREKKKNNETMERTFTERSEETLECRRQVRYWSERLEALEAERRREVLLTSFKCDPKGTWRKLTEEEKQGNDLVYHVLANYPQVFGRMGLLGTSTFWRRALSIKI
jgi:hypothetical protein